MNGRFVVRKSGQNVGTADHSNHSTGCESNHGNRTSYLTYCSSQPLIDSTSHQIISQNNSHSHIQTIQTHDNNNHSLPPMSSFVATNVSQNVSTGRSTHALLSNQDLNIELLTAQTSPELDSYNGDALDQTFVDALNMSQFVFDPFLSDGQSMAAQVNNDGEETTYYTSETTHLGPQGSGQTSTHSQTQTQTNQAFGLSMGPHMSDIFSVLDSLTETDALTESLLNVSDNYCNSEQLVSNQPNLNSNTYLPQTHQQIQTTIQIPSSLASNPLISHSSAVHLTPIVLSRPTLQTQPMIGQPLIQTTESSDNNQMTNHLSNISRNESQSIDKINAKTIHSNNSNVFRVDIESDERVDTKELIEETKCFKCLICNFISLEKSIVSNHLNEKHKNETKVSSIEDNSKSMANKRDNTYMCSKCFKGFPTLSACRQHMVSAHKLRVDNVTLQTIESDQNISPDKDKTLMKGIAIQKEVLSETHDNSLNKKASKLRHILPNGQIEVQQQVLNGKKTKQVIVAKTHVNHNNNQIITNITNNNNTNLHNNHMTAKRNAWKKKVRREQGTYICEFKGCSVRFRALENLQKHHICHSDSGSGFVCSNCNKNSEQWPSMAGHLWRSHGIDLELHACEHCSYRTYSLSVLENIHKRIHSNEKNFLCDTCGKGFKNCKQLINHKVKHVVKNQVLKTYECHICLRTFTDARTRKVHLNTVHHKTRPYICSHCNHSAASRSALRTHMRQHTGEKPFKCDKCNYSTSDHNSLRRHKMRHSGERPYKCPFCSYACIQSSTYKQHLKNKHPGLSEGIMFNCEFCGFKTVNQDMYGTHISEHNRNGDKNGIKVNKNRNKDLGSTLVIASGQEQDSPDSPTLQFACIVGQSISSQTNTPSITTYASDFIK